MGYNFEIQYRLSLENCAADALSWLHSPVTLMALTIPQVLQLDQLKKEVGGKTVNFSRLSESSKLILQVSWIILGWMDIYYLYGSCFFPRFDIDSLHAEGRSWWTHWGLLRVFEDIQTDICRCVLGRDEKRHPPVCSPLLYVQQICGSSPWGLLQSLPIPYQI